MYNKSAKKGRRTKRIPTHVWRVLMRISVLNILILAVGFQLLMADPGIGQELEDIQITMELEDEPLVSVFKTIEQKTDYLFAYRQEQVNGYRASLDDGTRSLKEVMDLIMTGTRLEYQVAANKIIVKRKALAIPVSRITEWTSIAVSNKLQTGIITGKVTDGQTGEPLVGANVGIEGTSLGSSTDENGQFRIEDMKAGSYTLTASYIGYNKVTKEVTLAANETITANFSLQPSTAGLEEMVVTGTLGRATRKSLATSVSVITGEEIEDSNVAKFMDLFKGEIPGVISLSRGAASFQSQSITIRGNASIVTGSQVLILVDGVEVNPEALQTISADNIERVEVIRGAQASTIYGSEASGGVIQIFTKKGGDTTGERIELSTTLGMTKSPYVEDSPLFQEYNASLSGDMGGGSYNIGVAHTRRDGYVPHQNRQLTSFSAGFQRSVSEFDLSFFARYSNNAFDFPSTGAAYAGLYQDGLLPPNYTLYSNDTGEHRNLNFGFKADYSPLAWWNHHLTVGTNLVQRDYPFPPDLVDEDSTGARTTYEYSLPNIRYYTDAQFSLHRNLDMTLAAGFDWNKRNVFIQRSTFLRAEKGPSVGGYVRERDYTNTGIFGELRLAVADHLFATAGLRSDYNSNYGEEFGNWSTNPRLGLTYVNEVLDGWTIKPRISWGRGITAPTPRMTRGSPPQILPNPELGPQRTTGWEAGLGQYFLDRRLFIETVYYHQLTENTLNGRYIEYPSPTQFINGGEILNEGIEFKIRWKQNPFETTFTLATNHNEVVSLADSAATGEVGKPISIPVVPKLTSALKATYSLEKHTNLPARIGFLVSHIGERYAIDFADYFSAIADGTVTGGATDYSRWFDGLTRVSIWAGYDFTEHFSAEFRVENAFNNLEAETPGFVVPGRRLQVTLRAQF